jgi:hypothetical protein
LHDASVQTPPALHVPVPFGYAVVQFTQGGPPQQMLSFAMHPAPSR